MFVTKYMYDLLVVACTWNMPCCLSYTVSSLWKASGSSVLLVLCHFYSKTKVKAHLRYWLPNPVACLCRSASSRPLHFLLVWWVFFVASKALQWEYVSVINWLLPSANIYFLSVKQTCWEPHLVITHFHGHSLVVVRLMWLDEVLGSVKISLNLDAGELIKD